MSNYTYKRPPEVYTPAEIRKLMKACGRGVTGVRNRALLAVLWRSGARIAEALALTLADLDEAKGTLRVRRGKGNKYRTIGLDSDGYAVLRGWLDVRRAKVQPKRSSPVFCTLDGAAVSPAYVRQLLPRLQARADMAKRVHAHGFRHTHATELAMEGVPLPVIAAQLGHTNITTTVRYLARIAPKQVVDAIRKRESWSD